MPNLPPKPCPARGCGELVAGGGYCPAHTRNHSRTYDATRPSAALRGYGRRWRGYRSRYLRQHPLCSCGEPSTDVDHIEAVTGPADRLFWVPSNHQPLCHSCHSAKTAREDGGLGKTPQCANVSHGGGSDSLGSAPRRPIGQLAKKQTQFCPPGGYPV